MCSSEEDLIVVFESCSHVVGIQYRNLQLEGGREGGREGVQLERGGREGGCDTYDQCNHS